MARFGAMVSPYSFASDQWWLKMAEGVRGLGENAGTPSLRRGKRLHVGALTFTRTICGAYAELVRSYT